jgi:hypothetical protein
MLPAAGASSSDLAPSAGGRVWGSRRGRIKGDNDADDDDNDEDAPFFSYLLFLSSPMH